MVRVLRHGASAHGNGDVVEVGVGQACIPLWAEMVDGSRRIFWWDFVRSRQGETVCNSHELVPSPGIRMVVKTLPKGSEAPLNLAGVSLCGKVEVV